MKGEEKRKEAEAVDDINMIVPIKPFAIITVSLPGFSLLICFLTGFFFRFEDVNETMCEVGNIYIIWRCPMTFFFSMTFFF